MSRLNKALSAPYLRLRIGLLISALPRDRTSPGPCHPRCRVAVQLSLTALAQSCTSSNDAGIRNAGRPSTRLRACPQPSWRKACAKNAA